MGEGVLVLLLLRSKMDGLLKKLQGYPREIFYA